MSIANAVRNKVEGTISGGLKKVVGGILGSNRSNIKMPISGMKFMAGGKYSTKQLQYPLNVADDPMQGHYIMFNINVLKKPKVEATKNFFDKPPEFVTGDPDDYEEDDTSTQQIKGLDKSAKQNLEKGGLSKNSRSVYKEMSTSSKRLDTVISLYMPPSVTVNYGAKYGGTEIGMMADTGLNAFKAFMAGGDVTMGNLSSKVAAAGAEVSKGAGEMLPRAAIKAADAFATGTKALAQIEMGQILGKQMELMFDGINRRSFSFTFIFIPKSEKESQTVDQIIKTFKYHMLPSYVGDSRRAMTIPDMFDITYMYKGAENQFLNKISTCFLESANVTYGGDRFTAYETTQTMDGGSGAPPQRTTLALSFKEIELITRELAQEGF
tara:strand:- start:2803 stop:3945 length:1143 start_codon:yes stop_codon:yes gene_type:complete